MVMMKMVMIHNCPFGTIYIYDHVYTSQYTYIITAEGCGIQTLAEGQYMNNSAH